MKSKQKGGRVKVDIKVRKFLVETKGKSLEELEKVVLR